MVKTALYVHMEAKPGKEAEVQKFLEDGLALVNQEPATTAWFAMAMGHGHFGIFDAFPDEAGRNAHLNGAVAAALMAKAADLFAKPPTTSKVDFPTAKGHRKVLAPVAAGGAGEHLFFAAAVAFTGAPSFALYPKGGRLCLTPRPSKILHHQKLLIQSVIRHINTQPNRLGLKLRAIPALLHPAPHRPHPPRDAL